MTKYIKLKGLKIDNKKPNILFLTKFYKPFKSLQI